MRIGKNFFKPQQPQPFSNSNKMTVWLWPLLFKIGGSIFLFVIICKILTALMPFLILGAIGWFFIVARR